MLLVRARPVRPASAGSRCFGVLDPALSFALFDLGLSRTGAADGALLIASEGLFGALFAWLVLRERVGPVTAIALAFGFAGSALVALGAMDGHASIAGDLLVLGASASAAVYGVAARRLVVQTDALAATATQMLAAALVALPAVALNAAGGGSHLDALDGGHLLAAVATGVLGGAIPFLLFNVAIRDVNVAGASLLLNLIPVLATGLAVLLLGERLGWSQLAGGILVIAAAFGAPEPTSEPPAGSAAA